MKRRILAGASRLRRLVECFHRWSDYSILQKAAYVTLPFRSKMLQIIPPTSGEVLQWLVHTATHAYHIEYYLQTLGVGLEDPDRPHDIVHLGNKLEWGAVKGLALQFRKNGCFDHRNQILDSRAYHRQQSHHQRWNEPNTAATGDNLKLGAVDAICSLVEPREYQGGPHNFTQIESIAKESKQHQKEGLSWAIREMRKIDSPDIAHITKLGEIPRRGIFPQTYDTIIGRVREALGELKNTQGYKFPDFNTL